MSQQEETTQPTAPSDETASVPPAPAAVSSAVPLLMGVKLPIRILLGRTELLLGEIARLGAGAVVELDCSPDDPVEIMVNDRVIAHGEVVVVDGNYGVRITKIAARGSNSEPEGQAAELLNLSGQLR
ncbi:MAG TPA: flagellar motor switch protein FliN [Bryobacteraceae bacterium]|nr:flagellar motor switch protein FliN [Bryobacteraceae bacterium]